MTEAAARSVHPAALERKRQIVPAIFGGSLLALAAAAALYISAGRHKEATLSAAKEVPLVVHGEPPSASTPTLPAASAGVVALNTLPQAVAEPAGPAEVDKPVVAVAPMKKGLAFRVKKEAAAKAGNVALEDSAETSNAVASQAAAAPQAVAPPQSTLAERPGTGAVQGALGAVLQSARGCLAGQETASRAVVTFDGATGRVKSVTLEGPGAGSPAEPCVRAAFMAAKLPPFSDPSFTASIAVRPL